MHLDLNMKYKALILIVYSLLFVSCSEYVKFQKSTDPETKFIAGKNFFMEKKYTKSITMFESVIHYYRGTPQAEEVMYFIAESYLGQKNYYSASEYYNAYIRNFPRGKFSQDVTYKIAYCYYKDSPDARLDQTTTENAIQALREYIEIYPNTDKVSECRTMLSEMEDKLAYKGFLNAKLYYNLGLYGGNNYRAAIVTAENTLREYPDSKYKDDIMFIILQSKSKEASLSVAEKGGKRD